MRWPIRWSVLLAICVIAPGSSLLAQNETPAKDGKKSSSQAATEEEVEQLRKEVADLKAMIQQLTRTSASQGAGNAHLVQARAGASDSDQPDASGSPSATAADIDALQKEIELLQKKADSGPPVTSGWNGEHFFLKSSDGQFTLMPVGYLNAQYNFYRGDGAPSDQFYIRRARLGFQGTYSKYIDYAFLYETANTPTNPIGVRDAYIDFKPWTSLSFEGGQFKVPFSLEVGTGDTNVQFLERSINAVLYPDFAGAFRAPGLIAHGSLNDGVFQYWGGIFNGKGLIANNTTNEPEVVARVRFNPFKKDKDSLFNKFGIGGSFEHSRTRGLSNELSFSSQMNDFAYNVFPQFRINGGVWRYNAHFVFLHGPLDFRGEYTQIQMSRSNVGSLQLGGEGFISLPSVIGKGTYAQVSYYLTGEDAPENAQPRVKRPVIGPESPGMSNGHGWGAFQVGFRYSWLEGKAPGFVCDATHPFPPPSTLNCPITPAIFPAQSAHTDQFTFGLNWYLNYWVLLKTNFNIDRLKNPSVQGINPQNYYVFLEGIQFRF